MMGTVEKLSGIRLKNYLDFRKDPLGFLLKTREVADFVELGASSYVVHQPEAIKQILVTNAASFQNSVKRLVEACLLLKGKSTKASED